MKFLIILLLFLSCTTQKSIAQEKSTFIISDFGVIGDGKTLNTNAIQKAIDLANSKGGGKVIVPKGRFFWS